MRQPGDIVLAPAAWTHRGAAREPRWPEIHRWCPNHLCLGRPSTHRERDGRSRRALPSARSPDASEPRSRRPACSRSAPSPPLSCSLSSLVASAHTKCSLRSGKGSVEAYDLWTPDRKCRAGDRLAVPRRSTTAQDAEKLRAGQPALQGARGGRPHFAILQAVEAILYGELF